MAPLVVGLMLRRLPNGNFVVNVDTNMCPMAKIAEFCSELLSQFPQRSVSIIFEQILMPPTPPAPAPAPPQAQGVPEPPPEPPQPPEPR